MAQMPDAIAVSNMYPDKRVSLPMTTRTLWFFPRRATNATALPRRKAISGVIGGSFAAPRTPSVPKSLRVLLLVGSAGVSFFLVVFVLPTPSR
jgi:hypothetical protein